MDEPVTRPSGEDGLAVAGSLENYDVKLVFYTIVSVKRGFEMILPGGQGGLIVVEKLTDEQFTAMIIARYFKSKDYKDYKELLEKKNDRGTHMFTEADVKYLRVQFVMAYKWPREPVEEDRREAEALERMRDIHNVFQPLRNVEIST
jgi:hypothetical protein